MEPFTPAALAKAKETMEKEQPVLRAEIEKLEAKLEALEKEQDATNEGIRERKTRLVHLQATVENIERNLGQHPNEVFRGRK